VNLRCLGGGVGFNCGCDELIKKWKALFFSMKGHQAGGLKAAKEGNQLGKCGAEKGRLTLSPRLRLKESLSSHWLKEIGG